MAQEAAKAAGARKRQLAKRTLQRQCLRSTPSWRERGGRPTGRAERQGRCVSPAATFRAHKQAPSRSKWGDTACARLAFAECFLHPFSDQSSKRSNSNDGRPHRTITPFHTFAVRHACVRSHMHRARTRASCTSVRAGMGRSTNADVDETMPLGGCLWGGRWVAF